jgi:hypothetical protein
MKAVKVPRNGHSHMSHVGSDDHSQWLCATSSSLQTSFLCAQSPELAATLLARVAGSFLPPQPIQLAPSSGMLPFTVRRLMNTMLTCDRFQRRPSGLETLAQKHGASPLRRLYLPPSSSSSFLLLLLPSSSSSSYSLLRLPPLLSETLISRVTPFPSYTFFDPILCRTNISFS